MNTGPLSRHDLGVDEDARWWRTMGGVELSVTGYGFNGAWYIFACQFDSNAMRLSILVDRHDGRGRVWAGVFPEIRKDSNGCMGVGLADGLTITAGFDYFAKQESPSSFAVSYNEACVKGSVTCP